MALAGPRAASEHRTRAVRSPPAEPDTWLGRARSSAQGNPSGYHGFAIGDEARGRRPHRARKPESYAEYASAYAKYLEASES